MAAGAYSSIFIATPLLAQLKSSETEVKLAEKRAQARARREADPYAAVPAFTEDMPIQAEPDAVAARARPVARRRRGGEPAATGRSPEATGRGRVAPPARGRSAAAAPPGASSRRGRRRSKRGKK